MLLFYTEVFMVTELKDMRFIDELQLKNKAVFIRCDFNVPLKNGVITDDTRIVEALPTIKFALESGAKVILGSHLGRPKGKIDPALSLKPIGEKLVELLNREVLLTDTPDSDGLKKMIEDLKSNQIILLENLRYSKFEEENDSIYAKRLAANFDVYVNDAFGTAHRAEVSTEGMAHHVSEAVGGFLIKKEVEKFNKMLNEFQRRFVAILGGAKVSDKIEVIKQLMNKVDKIIIGGAMANTFLAAQGVKVGKSKIESDKLDLAKELITLAKEKNIELLLPVDLVGAVAFDNNTEFGTYELTNFPEDRMALDIGVKTM